MVARALLVLLSLPAPALAAAPPMACAAGEGVGPSFDVLWPGCGTFAPFSDVGLCPPGGRCPRPCGEEAIGPDGAVVRARRFEWTGDGKLAAQHTTTPTGGTTTERYSWERGRLVGREDQGGSTRYLWNDRGHLFREVYEAPGILRTTTWTRDDAGRITQVTGTNDEGGHRYTYGDDGRLLSRVDPSDTKTYAYDEEGRLVRTSDGRAVAEWTWGPRGQVERHVYRYEDEPPSVTTYVYDEAGRPMEARTERDSGTWRIRWTTRCE